MQADSAGGPSAPGIGFRRSQMGAGFRLETALLLPRERERLFEFFSDAFRLETLTPPWLRFRVVTAAPIRIETGTVIDYRLRIRGIPIRWRSRITVWDPPRRFVDEQVRGPYSRWCHEHVFESVEGGTLCRDIVDYAVFGGWLIDSLVVRRDLRRVFAFRHRRLKELFCDAALPA
jgi:ligand-binding SRPBCC domain-containing protein